MNVLHAFVETVSFPFSIAHDINGDALSCASGTVQRIPGAKLGKEFKIAYTCDFKFIVS